MTNAAAVEAQDAPDPHYSEYVLSQLRCAALRARLVANEIDSIGVALRANWINAEQAVAEVADLGALGLLRVER